MSEYKRIIIGYQKDKSRLFMAGMSHEETIKYLQGLISKVQSERELKNDSVIDGIISTEQSGVAVCNHTKEEMVEMPEGGLFCTGCQEYVCRIAD